MGRVHRVLRKGLGQWSDKVFGVSGVVELVLTDKELQIILQWFWNAAKGVEPPLEEKKLGERLARYKHVLECPAPMLCAPRDLDPNAP